MYNTRLVSVGRLTMGGRNPVWVQSMTNTDTRDVAATLAQIRALAGAGCDLVRISVYDEECARAVRQLVDGSPVPLVADIHFDHHLAVMAAENGISKLRINPGNIGGLEATDEVIQAAREAGIPIRVGVNAGSLDQALKERTDLTLPQKLAQSASEYVEYFYSRGFKDVVVSAKAHDVPATIATYRLLAQRIPEVPLHIGITEAGTAFQGIIKSAAGLGVLLEQGIGNTLRISLTDDPVTEIRACWTLLSALGLRERGPEIISCPTCGRCQVDLIGLAKQVEERLAVVEKPMSVAVMGCVVNGPGEAADADIGVACGNGVGVLFAHGNMIRKVAEDQIVDALMEEINKL